MVVGILQTIFYILGGEQLRENCLKGHENENNIYVFRLLILLIGRAFEI
jgi:hypothetical protein